MSLNRQRRVEAVREDAVQLLRAKKRQHRPPMPAEGKFQVVRVLKATMQEVLRPAIAPNSSSN